MVAIVEPVGAADPLLHLSECLRQGNLIVLAAGRMATDPIFPCPYCGDGLEALQGLALAIMDEFKNKRLYQLLVDHEREVPLSATTVKCPGCGRYIESLIVYVPEATV